MELLAPAGDFPCLEAAIAAGADAVYLGLSLLNARRGAKNFTPAELERAVELARQHDVDTHLAMNIDISRRETGAAARILAMARDIGVDAIIARDWAVAGLWRAMADRAAADGGFCPALHISTQSAVTNPDGIRLARDIGARRVVLARELTLEEIRLIVASADGVEIEVFAQGALCYSISGRCLMSSWGGGRSGNRGLCASPCRAPWSVDGEAVGTAMSMRDLATVERLGELAAAGVASLKIEGRLKKPEWVAEAVELYRRVLGPRKTQTGIAEKVDAEVVDRVRRLSAYAGRDSADGYLDGRFSGLTGVAARKSEAAAHAAIHDFLREEKARVREAKPEREGYSLDMTVTERGISCRCAYGGKSVSWRMPKTRIRREKKALSVEELFAELRAAPFGDVRLGESFCNEPDLLLPPRNSKAITAAVAAFINRLTGRDDDGADAVLKAPLPDEMRAALAAPPTHPDNVRRLGERPNRVRLSIKQVTPGLLTTLRDVDIVLLDASAASLEQMGGLFDRESVTIAFPDIYFSAESAAVRELAEYCRDRNIRVEANCWGSLQLCRELGLDFIVGPGLPVLNHLAVKCLRDLGARGATVSMEADRRQMEELTAVAPLPLTLIVYARPILAYTRIPRADLLPNGADAAEGGAWTDRRGISLVPGTASGVTFFRSLTAFDWKGLANDRIRASFLAVDLSGESFPGDVWKKVLRPGGKRGFLFNYDRGLK